MTVCFCRPPCVFCILESYSASLIHSMYVEDKSHNIYIQYNLRLFDSGGGVGSSFKTKVTCVF